MHRTYQVVVRDPRTDIDFSQPVEMRRCAYCRHFPGPDFEYPSAVRVKLSRLYAPLREGQEKAEARCPACNERYQATPVGDGFVECPECLGQHRHDPAAVGRPMQCRSCQRAWQRRQPAPGAGGRGHWGAVAWDVSGAAITKSLCRCEDSAAHG